MYRSLSGIDPTHYTASSARCPKEIHTRNDCCLIGSCDWNNPFVSSNPGDSYAFDKFSKDQGRSRLRLLFYLRWFFLRHVAAWLSRLGTTDPSFNAECGVGSTVLRAGESPSFARCLPYNIQRLIFGIKDLSPGEAGRSNLQDRKLLHPSPTVELLSGIRTKSGPAGDVHLRSLSNEPRAVSVATCHRER